jgi:hypothetical protein
VTARVASAALSVAAASAGGGSWPDPRQVLLLRAALLAREPALAAWRAWRAGADLDAVDPGSFRLLPLLWHHLTELGVEDPLLERCRGVFRHTWSKNQLLLHRAAPVLAALRRAGIDVLVLKGGAMAARYYPSPGARPMNDLDVLVPQAAAGAARELLADLGWTPTLDLPPSYLPFIHALGYRDADGTEIDLHWHAVWEASRPDADEPLWRAAEPLPVAGVEVLTLSPTDHLYQVAVHGLRWSELPPIHWAADAARVLAVAGAAVDWERLVSHAERERLTLQLAATLGFLREALEQPVPAAVVERLRRHPAGPVQRLEMWARVRPPSLARGALLHWCDYRRARPDDGPLRRAVGFPLYVRTIWGLPGLRHLPAEVLSKTLHRLRERWAA